MIGVTINKGNNLIFYTPTIASDILAINSAAYFQGDNYYEYIMDLRVEGGNLIFSQAPGDNGRTVNVALFNYQSIAVTSNITAIAGSGLIEVDIAPFAVANTDVYLRVIVTA